MRTTVTLDDDVAALLARRRRATGDSFKQVINSTLRVGLATLANAAEGGKSAAEPLPVFSVGRVLLPDLTDVSEVLALVEGEGYR